MSSISNLKKLTDYLKKNLRKGYTTDSLIYALQNQGYSRAIIDLAVGKANKEMAEEAPILKEKPIIKYELYDEKDNIVEVRIKKPWWKRLFGF